MRIEQKNVKNFDCGNFCDKIDKKNVERMIKKEQEYGLFNY